MKFYLSPLFIISTLLLFFSFCFFTESSFIPPTYRNALAALPIFFVGAVGIILHLLFKKIIGKNIVFHMLIEITLILSAVLLLVAV